MKFFKNKIFISVLSLIFLLFGLQFYFISKSYKRDTNSYVILLDGSATITTLGEKKVLKKEKKEKISNGDIINTLEKTLVVIEWGDKSITRLGENSKIIIKENFVSEDLGKINISFELLRGKTWSNVISIFSGNSYFKQEVKGVTAAVRGTVFEANYDDEYIVSHKHTVVVSNQDGKEESINPGQAFFIKTFSIENLKEVIDSSFKKLNEKLDSQYLEKLRDNFTSSLSESNPLNLIKKFSIENDILSKLNENNPKENFESFLKNLNPEKKQKVLSYLNTLNQSINFENGEDPSIYNLKLNIRQNLIDNTSDENKKETLVRYSVYDLIEVKSISNELYNKTLGFMEKNKVFLNTSELNNSGVKLIGDIMYLNGEKINLDNFKSIINSIDGIGQQKINSLLDNALNFIKNLFK